MIRPAAIRTTKTISVTSGKGGVGKTSILCNMALELASKGAKVLILDGDFGMANVDLMFGLRAESNLWDVVSGRLMLEDVVMSVTDNIDLIPGGSGVYELQGLGVVEKYSLLQQIAELEKQYDYLLVDTAPGIADNVLYLNAAADQTVVIVTPDPASITDSYALIKVLSERYRETRFSVLCNQVKDEREGHRLFNRLSDVAAEYLTVRLEYLGSVSMDLSMRQATKTQQLVLEAFPGSVAGTEIQKLAKNLTSYPPASEARGGMRFFWNQLVGVAL
ncbi:MAG: flagellar biosynthesis switch protein [Bdellovibrionaceae bacterium]|nr:flagellar biosynthesis switch protein [Pseudobdellovibrionaceae bacterium]